MKINKVKADLLLQNFHTRILSYTYFYDGIKKIGRVFLIENTNNFYVINTKCAIYRVFKYENYKEAFKKYIYTIKSYEEV